MVLVILQEAFNDEVFGAVDIGDVCEEHGMTLSEFIEALSDVTDDVEGLLDELGLTGHS